MTSTTVWKLDEQNSFPTNCFPARGLARKLHEGAGSWVVAYAEEQQNKLLAEFKPQAKLAHALAAESQDENPAVYKPRKTLNAVYLLRKHHISSPLDLCSVNISDKDLNDVQEEDFKNFVNVAYVNAAENALPLRPFSNFKNLRELELPVNGIENIQLHHVDFPNLQLEFDKIAAGLIEVFYEFGDQKVLDLSYNRLNAGDVLFLGVLQNLKVLTLTGNGLTSIHPDMARPDVIPVSESENEVLPRFSKLEVLYLDDNHLSDLSTFASLAALPQLRELNLDKNGIEIIPHLKVVGDKVISETQSSIGHHISVASSGKKSRQSVGASSGKIVESKEEIVKTPSPVAQSPNPDVLKTEESAENQIEPEYSDDVSTPNPPFQHLRLLSVTHNRIKEEECVLAVAAWPRLKHIVLHHNPLVEHTKGEPPLLAYYLKERLGINLHRFEKKTSVPKPHLTIPVEKDRKVTTIIPKIPKQPVDVLINSLMAPTSSNALPEKTATDSATQNTATDSATLQSATDEMREEKTEENVFLTQVDEPYDEIEEERKKKKKSRKKKEDPQKELTPEEQKFKGYEILLDAQESECPLEDAGIQGNVRMLNRMLNHPNHYQTMATVTLDRVQPVYEPQLSRHTDAMQLVSERKQKKLTSKQAQLAGHLKNMRHRNVIDVEVPLVKALQSEEHEHLVDEAEELLELVEKKYRVVREESLKASEDVKAALEDSRKLMADLGQ